MTHGGVGPQIDARDYDIRSMPDGVAEHWARLITRGAPAAAEDLIRPWRYLIRQPGPMSEADMRAALLAIDCRKGGHQPYESEPSYLGLGGWQPTADYYRCECRRVYWTPSAVPPKDKA